jgi:alpha-N-acetylglucosaminidase
MLLLVFSCLPRPAASQETQNAAAQAVLQRLLGSHASAVHLHVDESREHTRDWYQVSSTHNHVDVSGSSPVALVHGAYAFLETQGYASVSWEGNRIALPTQWPDYNSGIVTTPFAHRVYLNPCTYGYTTPWWDWPRWEREIDWMALHGIDMPLALEGQEIVWQQLWREFGVSDAALGEYFSGPAFAPWQRMGNIEGHDAPLSQHWIDDKAALQQRILARMHELGMEPVLPAFAGYVPKAFALAHPQAHIYRMRPWEGFHETYWLDPSDPLFAKIAARFIQLYTQRYGKGRYYLADAFNEMLPPMSDDNRDQGGYGDHAQSTGKQGAPVSPDVRDRRLAAYGKAIFASIDHTAPGATWVMQSWLFGADQHFWNADAIAAFLRDVPDDRLLVLDIGNDRYPDVWKRAGAFHGKRWIYGYVFNYGGSNPVYGDLNYYRQDLATLTGDAGVGKLTGFGVFPEGLHSNSVVYAYLYALAWESHDEPLATWLARYTRARYGHTSPGLLDAWSSLQQGVFDVRYWSPRWWQGTAGAYLLFRRPGTEIVDFPGAPGDPQRLLDGLQKLLALSNDFADAPLFRYDLVDFTRHYASERIDQLLQQTVRDYQRGDIAHGDANVRKLHDVVGMLDALLGGQQDTLSSWIDEARRYARTPDDARAYERNAKALITVWGGDGNLHDYASRAWRGMYREFYLPRWDMFFAAMRTAAQSGKPFDEGLTRAAITQWEQHWVENGATYRRQVPNNTVGDIRALLKRLEQP